MVYHIIWADISLSARIFRSHRKILRNPQKIRAYYMLHLSCFRGFYDAFKKKLSAKEEELATATITRRNIREN